MLQKTKQRNDGFTIIEVLIVLAIAGLILLVVFMAVPALQRNSRNTQRKQDVSALLGGIQEWENNNAGKIPSTAAEQTSASSNAKMGYYPSVSGWKTGAQGAITTDDLVIVTGAKCDPTTPITGKTIDGSARQIAVQYMYEDSSGLKPTCQDS